MTNNLNVPHNVTLTEGQISTILYIMEGYLQGSDDTEDTQFNKDCDNIFQILEGKIDSYYESNSESNKNLSEITPERDANAADFESKVLITSQELEGDISTIKDSDYIEIDGQSVLKSNTEASDEYNFVEHTSECA